MGKRTNGRAWIIGNGLSLRDTPLDLLRGERTFGLNRISMAFEWTDWRPTYYVRAEFNDPEPEAMTALHLEEPDTYCFINVQKAVACEAVTFPRFPTGVSYLNMRCAHHTSNINHGQIPETWHLPKVCEFGGVGHIAIQLAVLLGNIDEIYLVGFDLGWKEHNRNLEPDPNHFDAAYGEWDMFPLVEKDDTHILYHEIAKREAEERGVKIFNATVGGKLEVYDRVDMREVLDADRV